MISRDSCLPHDTRNSMGPSGNVFENLPARDGPSSAFLENSKSLASTSCGLRQRNTGDESRRILQYQLFVLPKGLEYGTLYLVLEELILKKLYDGNSEVFYLGTASRKFPRLSGLPVLEGQLQDRSVCKHCPTLTMSWIEEVEIATSINDLMTSQSIEKIFSNSNFRRRQC